MHLLRRWPWSLDIISGVAGDEVPSHSLGKRLVQDMVDLLDRRAGEAGIQALAVEALNLECVHVLELHASDGRLDVVGDEVLVPRVGGLPDGAVNAVGEPAVQVLSESQVFIIIDEALVAVRHCFRELSPCIVAILAADVAALGAFCGMHHVSSPVANLLPVLLVGVDRAFTVAVLRHQSSFISSRGSTPSASASLRIVRGCARCLPVSRRLIVSKAIPVMRDTSRWDSARSRLSRLNRAPSTSVNLLFILALY